MRVRFLVPALMLTLMMSAPARADPPKLAVFDFELIDTSLQGEANGPQADSLGWLRPSGARHASADDRP